MASRFFSSISITARLSAIVAPPNITRTRRETGSKTMSSPAMGRCPRFSTTRSSSAFAMAKSSLDFRFGINDWLVRLEADVTAGLPALLEVLLVVVLRRVEGGRTRDLGDDRLPALFLPSLERCRRGRLLGGVVKEDRRTVLRPQVPTLTV